MFLYAFSTPARIVQERQREGVTDGDRAMETFAQFVQQNPYTGTAEQVVTLSLGIAAAGKRLSRPTFSLWRDESGIGEKVFSKLKVIGERLGELDDKTRRAVVKGLPASYSAIHLLCALKPEELVTAVQSGQVTPKTSVRAATAYIKQVRFPQQASKDGEKGRWGKKEEALFRICRPDDIPMSEEEKADLEQLLHRVCADYRVLVRKGDQSITSLRDEDRRQKASFWRSVLERELPLKWFKTVAEKKAFKENGPNLSQQFNIKTPEELWDAPLRSFTGFLRRSCGLSVVEFPNQRETFWQRHGQAYIAKLHYLYETTESRATKYNLKRRIEEVLEDESGTYPQAKELAIWRNIQLKNSGLL